MGKCSFCYLCSVAIYLYFIARLAVSDVNVERSRHNARGQCRAENIFIRKWN